MQPANSFFFSVLIYIYLLYIFYYFTCTPIKPGPPVGPSSPLAPGSPFLPNSPTVPGGPSSPDGPRSPLSPEGGKGHAPHSSPEQYYLCYFSENVYACAKS